MLESLSALNVQIGGLIYTPSILYKTTEEEKKKSETEMSETDVLNALKFEPYDSTLTASDIVSKYGVSYSTAMSVLEKYQEQYATLNPPNQNINQNQQQGDTFTYIS